MAASCGGRNHFEGGTGSNPVRSNSSSGEVAGLVRNDDAFQRGYLPITDRPRSEATRPVTGTFQITSDPRTGKADGWSREMRPSKGYRVVLHRAREPMRVCGERTAVGRPALGKT